MFEQCPYDLLTVSEKSAVLPELPAITSDSQPMFPKVTENSQYNRFKVVIPLHSLSQGRPKNERDRLMPDEALAPRIYDVPNIFVRVNALFSVNSRN